VPYSAKYVICPACGSRNVRSVPKGYKPLDLGTGRHYNKSTEPEDLVDTGEGEIGEEGIDLGYLENAVLDSLEE